MKKFLLLFFTVVSFNFCLVSAQPIFSQEKMNEMYNKYSNIVAFLGCTGAFATGLNGALARPSLLGIVYYGVVCIGSGIAVKDYFPKAQKDFNKIVYQNK